MSGLHLLNPSYSLNRSVPQWGGVSVNKSKCHHDTALHVIAKFEDKIK